MSAILHGQKRLRLHSYIRHAFFVSYSSPFPTVFSAVADRIFLKNRSPIRCDYYIMLFMIMHGNICGKRGFSNGAELTVIFRSSGASGQPAPDNALADLCRFGNLFHRHSHGGKRDCHFLFSGQNAFLHAFLESIP